MSEFTRWLSLAFFQWADWTLAIFYSLDRLWVAGIVAAAVVVAAVLVGMLREFGWFGRAVLFLILAGGLFVLMVDLASISPTLVDPVKLAASQRVR